MKNNKPQWTNNKPILITTTNKFEPLRHTETDGNSRQEQKDKAALLILAQESRLQQLTATTGQVVKWSNNTLKIINNDQSEYDRTITDIIKRRELRSTHTSLGYNVHTAKSIQLTAAGTGDSRDCKTETQNYKSLDHQTQSPWLLLFIILLLIYRNNRKQQRNVSHWISKKKTWVSKFSFLTKNKIIYHHARDVKCTSIPRGTEHTHTHTDIKISEIWQIT
jgi:hypothetical protein